MHRHHQTIVYSVPGPRHSQLPRKNTDIARAAKIIGTKDGEPIIPDDLAVRNGKLRDGRKRRTPRVPAPNCEPQDKGNMDPFVWKRTWTSRARNAWSGKRDRHIFFVPRHMVPKERTRDVTYGLITCLIRPEKIDEPNRTRLVAGGDRVHYPFDAGTPTADLLTVKLLINSVISTPGARFFTMDIKTSI